MKKLFLYVFLVLMFCNTAIAKDLNGIKLFCKGDNEEQLDKRYIIEEYLALFFIENRQVILSYMYVVNGEIENVYEHETTHYYKVRENNIDILTSKSNVGRLRHYGNIRLNRENLKMFSSITRDLTRPECKIVNYDPLERFDEKRKEIIETKKKKKKI